jgi:hypothetical protein
LDHPLALQGWMERLGGHFGQKNPGKPGEFGRLSWG